MKTITLIYCLRGGVTIDYINNYHDHYLRIKVLTILCVVFELHIQQAEFFLLLLQSGLQIIIRTIVDLFLFHF